MWHIHNIYTQVPGTNNHSWNLQVEKELYCRTPLTDLIQNRQVPRERKESYQELKAGGKLELFLRGSRSIFSLVKAVTSG